MQNKKLLSYWDAHEQLFYDAIKSAKIPPLLSAYGAQP